MPAARNGLFADVLAGKILFQGDVQHRCNGQSQQHIGEHIAAVVHQRVQVGIVEGAEARDIFGLVDPVNGDAADEMDQETDCAA